MVVLNVQNHHGGHPAAVNHPSTKVGSKITLGEQQKHNYLRKKFRIGAAGSRKDYRQTAVNNFCASDMPAKSREARKIINDSKDPDWLELKKKPFHMSQHLKKLTLNGNALGDQKYEFYHQRKDLVHERKKLVKMYHKESWTPRQRTKLPPGWPTNEELVRYLVAHTKKGPIGAYTKQWICPVDERGLGAHCVEPDWPDWNVGTGIHYAPEDIELNQKRFEEREAQRIRMNIPDKKINQQRPYTSPAGNCDNVTNEVRRRKIELAKMREQFAKDLWEEFPNASVERIEALSKRLLDEKILSDYKTDQWPLGNEYYHPRAEFTVPITRPNRRYYTYHHPGTFDFNPATNTQMWSCCSCETESSRGCEKRTYNPDRWNLSNWNHAYMKGCSE